MKVAPGTPCHSDLSQCWQAMKAGFNWDDELSSVAGCEYGEPRPTPIPPSKFLVRTQHIFNFVWK
jgi:hypothetical protein